MSGPFGLGDRCPLRYSVWLGNTRGRQRLKLPAFWFGPRVGVLPAFGEFTGGAVVSPRPGDRVFVVAGDQVVPVS